MPYDDPDPTDPLTLHGVVVETQDAQAMREMAECFVEEYIRVGFDPDRILQLFHTRGYAGPFLAYQTLGDEAIRSLIAEHLERRGRFQHRRLPERRASGDIGLLVLDDSHLAPRATAGEHPGDTSKTIGLTRGDS